MGKIVKKTSRTTIKRAARPAASAFKVIGKGDSKKVYQVSNGYGYFIPAFKDASTLTDVADRVEKGIKQREIADVIEFYNLRTDDIARAVSVSPRTVVRWKDDTLIGTPGSAQFFKMDELIRKGVELFGSEEDFQQWLKTPNMALGATPSELVTSPLGVEQIEEAIEALHFGNVI